MQTSNVVLERAKPSFSDAIKEDPHMKRATRLLKVIVLTGLKFDGSKLPQLFQLATRYVPLIKVNQTKLSDPQE